MGDEILGKREKDEISSVSLRKTCVFRRVLINDKRAYEFHLILSGGRGKRARIKGMINAH